METDLTARTIKINGYDVPEPVSEPLENGTAFWVPDVLTYNIENYVWTDHLFDSRMLKLGLIHLNQNSAKTHMDALLSFTRKDKP